MKVSNIVITTAAAISMAGALGIAYAQSTYTDPQTGTTGTMNRDSSTGTMSQDSTGTMNRDSTDTMNRDSTGTMNRDSTGTMNRDSTGSTGTTRSGDRYNERVARADRN